MNLGKKYCQIYVVLYYGRGRGQRWIMAEGLDPDYVISNGSSLLRDYQGYIALSKLRSYLLNTAGDENTYNIWLTIRLIKIEFYNISG